MDVATYVYLPHNFIALLKCTLRYLTARHKSRNTELRFVPSELMSINLEEY